MAFLTKIAFVSLLATSSFALPSATSDVKICSSNIDANPSIVPTLPSPLPTTLPLTGNLNIVPTPYKELDWNKGFRYIVNAPVYKSPPNAGIFDGVTQALSAARISIYGTVQYFTLKSAYFACFLQSQGAVLVPVSCTIAANGTKTNGERVSKDFDYTPSGVKQFELPSSFTELKSVVFGSALLATELTAVVLDDVEYTVYKPC